jgi:hypothetical protein
MQVAAGDPGASPAAAIRTAGLEDREQMRALVRGILQSSDR